MTFPRYWKNIIKMKELSLHILDLVQNSISAGADMIEILIDENTSKDILVISVKDNGKGIDKKLIEKVKDPFYTSRTERRVGLGISLLSAASERCGGCLNIESEIGKGTKVTASFIDSHIDRAPIGNMWDTIAEIIACNNDIDIVYKQKYNESEFCLDTREIRRILKGVPIDSPEVYKWLVNFLKSGIKNLYGGVDD
ncbi:MAG: ATP-binding protein [Clostridiales bacterium]|nr:ATP-binding protein [Clostridiales bacterium]